MRKNVANNVKLFIKLLIYMINSCNKKNKNINSVLIHKQIFNNLQILIFKIYNNKMKIWKIIINNSNFKDF